jgi:formylmethanofuran dehydrogenase subunit E
MTRILLLIILLWILYVVVKRFIAKNISNSDTKKEEGQTEKIVACSLCGLHIPEGESLTKNGKFYCNNPTCNEQDQHEH